MNELERIVDAAESSDGPLYLATVVDVVGSAYRRPGTRMLILPDGQHIGTISGGCLERDLCRQAAALCQSGPRLVSFDTRSEATDFNARYNLGCSGIIYVLVEPVTNDDRCPLRVARDVLSSGRPRTIGTVYQSDRMENVAVGDRLDWQTADEIEISSAASLRIAFDQVMATGKPICCQLISEARGAQDDSVARLFIETVSPPKPFWIFGAGDDAMPLAKVAGELGWSVTVVDDRAGNLTSSRFPSAARVLASVEEAKRRLVPTRETAAVLMTHSFSKDAELVPWLCETELTYIGLLGPKARAGKLIRKMHDAGILPDSSKFDRLHTPVGLDIGATDPAQIAVSIAAEIIAMEHDRSGGPLSARTEPIHDPVAHRLIDAQGKRPVRSHRLP